MLPMKSAEWRLIHRCTKYYRWNRQNGGWFIVVRNITDEIGRMEVDSSLYEILPMKSAEWRLIHRCKKYYRWNQQNGSWFIVVRNTTAEKADLSLCEILPMKLAEWRPIHRCAKHYWWKGWWMKVEKCSGSFPLRESHPQWKLTTIRTVQENKTASLAPPPPHLLPTANVLDPDCLVLRTSASHLLFLFVRLVWLQWETSGCRNFARKYCLLDVKPLKNYNNRIATSVNPMLNSRNEFICPFYPGCLWR